MLENLKKWSGSILLFPIGIWLIYNNGNFIPFVDHFTLLIHEGGHGIFHIFGSFIYILGGSLMQLIIAGLIVFYFYSNRKIPGVQISLLFLSENLLNISKYAADAQSRKLPLLGGNKVYHDWHFILGRMGILEYDYLVGYFFVSLAVIFIISAMLAPLLPSEKDLKNIDLDL